MIKKEELAKMADLAKIELSPTEIKEFGSQLSTVLDYFQKIKNYNLVGKESVKKEAISKLRADQFLPFVGADLKEQFSDYQGNLLKTKKIL